MKTSLATAVLAALLTSAVAPVVALAAPATTQQVAPNSASAVVLPVCSSRCCWCSA